MKSRKCKECGDICYYDDYGPFGTGCSCSKKTKKEKKKMSESNFDAACDKIKAENEKVQKMNFDNLKSACLDRINENQKPCVIKIPSKEFADFRKYIASEAHKSWLFIGIDGENLISYTAGGEWSELSEQIGAIEILKFHIMLTKAEAL